MTFLIVSISEVIESILCFYVTVELLLFLSSTLRCHLLHRDCSSKHCGAQSSSGSESVCWLVLPLKCTIQ